MATIKVYSKCPNSILFSTFNTQSGTDAHGRKFTSTRATGQVKVMGTNEYKKVKFKTIHVPNMLAMTEVDKDLWDKIMAERGDADVLLRTGQIFVAKNDEEAELKAQNAGRAITDFGTEAFYKTKSPVSLEAIY